MAQAKKQSKGRKILNWLKPTSPVKGMLLFAVVFALVGGSYFLYKSTAAAPVVTAVATPDGQGYWTTDNQGQVFGYGHAFAFGSVKTPLASGHYIVGITTNVTGHGYWLVAQDGAVFSFGDAKFYGSMGGKLLNKPIVGMTSTASGNGYWLVASDGGIFSFGDAKFYGSTGAIKLNKPIFSMARTASGNGYWLVASDGGIFSFGDAKFYGSTGNLTLPAPIVGIATTLSGKGYWLMASNGSVYAFGDAFKGNAPLTGPPGSFASIIPAFASRSTTAGWINFIGYSIIDHNGSAKTPYSGGSIYVTDNSFVKYELKRCNDISCQPNRWNATAIFHPIQRVAKLATGRYYLPLGSWGFIAPTDPQAWNGSWQFNPSTAGTTLLAGPLDNYSTNPNVRTDNTKITVNFIFTAISVPTTVKCMITTNSGTKVLAFSQATSSTPYSGGGCRIQKATVPNLKSLTGVEYRLVTTDGNPVVLGGTTIGIGR